MEAVPRMPMIAFELKTSPDQTEFSNSLLAYIADHYNERPDSYSKECGEIEQLRQAAVNVSRDFMGCSLLKRYYAQLHFLQSRFPMDDGGAVAIPFTWDDVYTGKAITHVDISFEQAAVLYNIGALHSYLGAMDKRGTPEGMKVSCTHFQCAAWAYQDLRDSYRNNFSPDMTSDLLTFKVNLMLAQAQECILEKSMTDNRKSTITAKVAAQIVEYYKLAMKNLDSGDAAAVISSRREWKKRLELKSQYYQCIMYLYLGNQSEEQQKWGERVAYFQGSSDRLSECLKLYKGDDEEVEEALKFTSDVVGGKLTAAKKDNDFIYHEKVPALDTLPEVKGAALVKGIPFNHNDPEISGQDIFQRLVPMEAHEASSVYSEEKAKLLREVGNAVDEKDQELSQYMSSLHVDPQSLDPEPSRLPQELLEKCAAISVRPTAIKDLVAAMQSLSGVSMDVEGNLSDIMEMIEEEEKTEADFQVAFGKRSPNTILTELKKECKKYQEGLEKAGQSNVELHKAMNTHITNLRLLSGPLEELQSAIPALDINRSPEDEALAAEVKKLMSKIEEMRKQREMLAEQFRQQVHNDDITSSLVTREQGTNEIQFFREQIKKHDKLRGLIEQNLAAQTNILRALTEANAKFANIRRNTSETSQRRESMIQGLIQSYDVYEDLLAKSQKGIEFYQKLESNVTRLLDRVKSNIKVCHEEREQILNRHKPKGPPPSRPTAPKPGTYPDTAALGTDMSSLPVSSLPETQGPTLKDFLPFMKPATFGSGAKGVTGGAGYSASATGQSQLPGNSQSAYTAGMPQSQYPAASQSQYPTFDQSGYRNSPTGQSGYMTSSAGQSGYPTSAGQSAYSAAAIGHTQPGLNQSQAQLPGLNQSQSATPPGSWPSSQTNSPAHVATSQAGSPAHYGAHYGAYTATGSNIAGYAAGQMTGYQTNQDPQKPKSTLPEGYSYVHEDVSDASESASTSSLASSTTGKAVAPSGAKELAAVPPGGQQGYQMPQYTGMGAQYGQYPGYHAPNAVQTQYIPGVSSQQAATGYTHGLPQQSYGYNYSQHPTSTAAGYPAQLGSSSYTTGHLAHPGSQLPAGGTTYQQTGGYTAGTGQYTAHYTGQYTTSKSMTTPSGYRSHMTTSVGAGLPGSEYSQQVVTGQTGHTAAGQPVVSGYQSASAAGQHMPAQQLNQNQPASGASHYYTAQSRSQGQYGYSQAGYKPQKNAYSQPAQVSSTSGQQTALTGTTSVSQSGYSQSSGHSATTTTMLASGQGHQTYPYSQQTVGTQQYQQGTTTSVYTGQTQQGTNKQAYPQQPSSVQGYPQQQAQGTQQYPQGTGQQAYQGTQGYQQQGTGAQGYQPQGTGTQGYQQQSTQAYQGTQGYQQQGTANQGYQQPGSGTQGYQQGTGTQGYQQQGTGTQVYQQQGTVTQGSQQQGTNMQGYQQGAGTQGYQQQGKGQTAQAYPQTQQSNQAYQQAQQGTQVYQGTSGQAYQQAQPGTSAYSQQGNYLQSGQSQSINTQGYTQNTGYKGTQSYPQSGTGSQAYSQQGTGSTVTTYAGKMPVSSVGHYGQTGQSIASAGISASQGQYGNTQVSSNQQGYTGSTPYTASSQSNPVYTYTGTTNTAQSGHYTQPSQQGYGQAVPGQTSQQTYGQYSQGGQYQYTQQGYAQQTAQQAGQGQPFQQSSTPQVNYQQTPGAQQQYQHYNLSQQPLKPEQASSKPQAQPQSSLGKYSQELGSLDLSIDTTLKPLTPDKTDASDGDSVTKVQQTANQLPGIPSGIASLSPNTNFANQAGGYASQQGQGLYPQQQVLPQHAASSGVQSSPTSGIKLERQPSAASNSSSLDDILSSSPTNNKDSIPKDVLKPKVITEEDIKWKKEEEYKKSLRQNPRDPYDDQAVLDKFVQEVEKFEKNVESLMKPTLSGPSPLETLWKEMPVEQEQIARAHGMAIARCYPLKNRSPEIMPYDTNRVVLTTGKDDYINASHLDDLSPCCPKLITTQCPLPATFADFWLMVYEQGTEVITMLCSEHEKGMQKINVYWPTERGRQLHHGLITLTLQSEKQKNGWTERIINLTHKEKRQSRSVVHLQYPHWLPSGVPDSPAPLLQFMNEVHYFYIHQRNLMKPVVVHCSLGIGRTGAFCLIYTGVQEISQGRGIIDIPSLLKKLLGKRKYFLQEMDQLRFCYHAVLYHAQEILMKRGILTNRASFSDKPASVSHQRKPSEDFILGGGGFSAVQSGIAKMWPKSNSDGKIVEANGTVQAANHSDANMMSQIHESSPPISDHGTPGTPSGGSVHSMTVGLAGGDMNVPMSASAPGSGVASPVVIRSRSGSNSSLHSQGSLKGSGSASPLHKGKGGGSLSNLPPSLAHLQNPNTFTLGEAEIKKKSKKDTFNSKGGIQQPSDPSDPFSNLDPLWSVKGQGPSSD